MSTHTNGVKWFLYIVLVSDVDQDTRVLPFRSDHDPSEDELRELLGLSTQHIEVERFAEDSIITLQPKGSQ